MGLFAHFPTEGFLRFHSLHVTETAGIGPDQSTHICVEAGETSFLATYTHNKQSCRLPDNKQSITLIGAYFKLPAVQQRSIALGWFHQIGSPISS